MSNSGVTVWPREGVFYSEVGLPDLILSKSVASPQNNLLHKNDDRIFISDLAIFPDSKNQKTFLNDIFVTLTAFFRSRSLTIPFEEVRTARRPTRRKANRMTR